MLKGTSTSCFFHPCSLPVTLLFIQSTYYFFFIFNICYILLFVTGYEKLGGKSFLRIPQFSFPLLHFQDGGCWIWYFNFIFLFHKLDTRLMLDLRIPSSHVDLLSFSVRLSFLSRQTNYIWCFLWLKAYFLIDPEKKSLFKYVVKINTKIKNNIVSFAGEKLLQLWSLRRNWAYINLT